MHLRDVEVSDPCIKWRQCQNPLT